MTNFGKIIGYEIHRQNDLFINIGGWSMDLKPVEKQCDLITIIDFGLSVIETIEKGQKVYSLFVNELK